jgi:hypothetical protein
MRSVDDTSCWLSSLRRGSIAEFFRQARNLALWAGASLRLFEFLCSLLSLKSGVLSVERRQTAGASMTHQSGGQHSWRKQWLSFLACSFHM